MVIHADGGEVLGKDLLLCDHEVIPHASTIGDEESLRSLPSRRCCRVRLVYDSDSPLCVTLILSVLSIEINYVRAGYISGPDPTTCVKAHCVKAACSLKNYEATDVRNSVIRTRSKQYACCLEFHAHCSAPTQL